MIWSSMVGRGQSAYLGSRKTAEGTQIPSCCMSSTPWCNWTLLFHLMTWRSLIGWGSRHCPQARLTVDSQSLTADFNDTIYSYGLVPLITRPTRVTETSATLIDNIFTNKIIRYGESIYGILQTIIQFFCIETSLKRKSIIVPFLKREYTEKNKIKFVDVMSILDWEDIYSATDMQCAFSLFHSKWIDAHHRCFPEKSFTRAYHIRKPWMTSCLRDAIKKKNKLYYKSIKIKCIRTKKMYEDYRNQIRKLMRAAEKKYHTDQILENKQN